MQTVHIAGDNINSTPNVQSLATSDQTANIVTFKRIKHDTNGNPRHVTSWCGFGFKSYDQAVKAANSIGGSRFNNKSFGGGLVFQSYECELASIAERLTAIAEGK